MNIIAPIYISAPSLITIVYLNDHPQVMFRLMFAGL